MKLSIITINYNNILGLERTIKSTISQTQSDYEWIVIDGGSSDGSKELIEKYSSHFAFWCSERDKGIYNAMNKGIHIAIGDYCLFLNSGDCFANQNSLEVILSRLESDIVSFRVFDPIKGASRILNNQNFCWSDLFQYSLPHQGTLIRTKLLKEHNYDETYSIIADWKFFLEALILWNASFSFHNQIIAQIEPAGISSKQNTIYHNEKKRMYSEVIPLSLRKDLENSSSYRDIGKIKITKFLYRCIYRLAILLS